MSNQPMTCDGVADQLASYLEGELLEPLRLEVEAHAADCAACGALLADLDLTPEEAARVHMHVGLDIGARTAPEVGLSVVAALVRRIRVDGLGAPAPGLPAPSSVQAVDPVCGMTVTVMAETPHLHHDGTDHWFCNPGCRDAFAASLAS